MGEGREPGVGQGSVDQGGGRPFADVDPRIEPARTRSNSRRCPIVSRVEGLGA